MPCNSKKTGRTESRSSEEAEDGLESGELDLSGIQLSEREARALSGLTPALARRLQRQLLAQLPPAAARQLRRTLSLHAPAAAAPAPRARSATRAVPAAPAAPAPAPAPPADPDPAAPTFSTLPRLKRHSREPTPPPAPEPAPEPQPEPPPPRAARPQPDRPLLSKYLTPERALSLDDSYSSDGGSLVSEPSYVAAYGARRQSLRAADPPRKRVSRFLRPDFFDAPPDESVFARQKREKELETQKILREIREKKNRALDSTLRSPTDFGDIQQMFREEPVLARKCVSPSILLGKERSRSNTPFFPILDNIKETAIDSSQKVTDSSLSADANDRKQRTKLDDISLNRDSKLTRPKSFPIKNLDQDEQNTNMLSVNAPSIDIENKDKTLPRESKLIRPKSYPTSSPSPEKVYITRNAKKEDSVSNNSLKEKTPPLPEGKSDIEVSFSISLPKKNKTVAPVKTESSIEPNIKTEEKLTDSQVSQSANLVLKKHVVVNNKESMEKNEIKDQKSENGISVNGNLNGNVSKVDSKNNTKVKVLNSSSQKEISQKSSEDGSEKKVTTKKKIIKKVSSKSKTDVASSDSKDAKLTTEKKKVTKKIKDKDSGDGAKTTVTKKKSVLQSIGHKLNSFASSKSNSPEKVCETKINAGDTKKENAKVNRTQREQSVPVIAEPPTESNLITRAVTITDVATLDNQPPAPSKTTVSKVLGLFKKFEPKDKVVKPPIDKLANDSDKSNATTSVVDVKGEPLDELVDDKPKRPTSLLLNGLGRKNKYEKASHDSASINSNEISDPSVLKKETESKNIRNSLKLDFSRLPRVKKIVPTEPVIEPRLMNVSPVDKESEKKEISEKNGAIPENGFDSLDAQSRSRSRSRSTFSNSEAKSDLSAEARDALPEGGAAHAPLRNHESTTPEREDIVERIRRKSFYSRFNEKKHRRRSNLVGPGAAEYDPLAVLHADGPASPAADLSPGYSAASDLSPSADRYRSLLTDLPAPTRNSRYDAYGLNDKIDTYRSLDRNEFRKYPGSRSYLDYDQPSSYGTLGHRYSRTKSLLDGGDGSEEPSLASIRDPHKYNRTLSMYSPGNYATYRPKRTRNSAIILKESEKEPSPENILERIRQRKNLSISVTRKPDSEKESLPRSTVPSKGEGDGAECSEKVN